ncbi:MAG TPA: hypothetical protein VFQ18_10290 [Candidatus Acidoferrum sp.]|nr:hypothetical protein [Candidatus Acidoferrum sp.]
MKTLTRNATAPLILTAVLLLCSSAVWAQQSTQRGLPQTQSIDLSREVSLLGTVIKYEPVSDKPPIGAHLLLQTASGQVNVHLGNAKVLEANHLTLVPGDSVRILGETRALGDTTYFAARIVQKGTQAVAVRSSRGFPLTPASTLTPAQKDALRGVR